MSVPNNWTELPLDGGGRSLVEASAGTGKTWTISVLYLRLLLEQGLSPRRIVVSTFTNAAAAELAERLRGKLVWALAESMQHVEGSGVVADSDEPADRRWLRDRWRNDPALLSKDVQRLQAALAEFDSAPISTLHSLCSRILAEHPFAAGALFRGRELIDGKTLESALVADLWRVIAQGDDHHELVQLARAAEIDRDVLVKYVPALMQPNVTARLGDPSDVVARIAAVVGDVEAWAAGVRAVTSAEGILSKNGRLSKAWNALAEALSSPDGSVADAVAEYVSDLRDAGSMKGVNKKGLEHPAVLALVAQSPAIATCFPPLSLDLAGHASLRRFLDAAQLWCRAAMRARLEAANQSTFDQLLVAVHEALAERDGQRALADALVEAWPVALVDEFQDTDPVQFGILDAIYCDAAGAPRGRLVMIGDPKQAIYRFRGGDVQAYERAKVQVAEEDCLTLDTNFRSSRAYVEAINEFYNVVGVHLGPKGSQTTIQYEAVQATNRRDAEVLCSARERRPVERPLVLHELEADCAAVNLEDRALRACAGQIVVALSLDGYCIGRNSLQPGDIAVLLPSHAQISKLSAMLKARGVPCVAVSQRSVFDTDTARDLRLVLHAALHPDDPRALRAALATPLWGCSLGDLQALRHDPASWDERSGRFHVLNKEIERRGPQAVVDGLLRDQAARLLNSVEGERMLTDLRHLGELLQEAWESCGGGERLEAWFAHQVEGGAAEADAADARALRLESDAGRVKLMTLHVSKGLEFGVVFLPMMWKHARRKPAKEGVQLLVDEGSGTKHIVLGPAKDIVEAQEHEERYRMLYVALTRAIHACHVFTLPRSDAVTKAVAAAKSNKGVPLNNVLAGFWKNEGADAFVRIDCRVGWQAHAGLTWSSGESGAGIRRARSLPRAPEGPLPMRHSFSTLSGGNRRRVSEEAGAADDEVQEVELPTFADADIASVDADAAAVDAVKLATSHPDLHVLAMVAGADFGNAVHAIFERRMPGVPLDRQSDLVRGALREQAVRPREGDLESLVKPLAARLQSVLLAPLGGDGPRLGALGSEDLCAEMEFNYQLDGASLRRLRDACEAHGEVGLVPLKDDRLAGLMNGKIDLVFAHGGRFHVLDYKSNRLGGGVQSFLEDYGAEMLEEAMRSHGYRFQALLYTIAVERYLRDRLGVAYRRDQHLGDCWYLFIRAVGLQLPDGRPCGVWRHRFNDALMDAVQAVLGVSVRQEAA